MFTRMVNQAKLRSFNTVPRYKYGFEVPRNYDHAMRLDQKNKNSLWKDAVATELQQINDYQTFIDKGHHTKTSPPAGYKKIRVHLVFDVKHDGRHKARLVADGHLTDIPLDSVYSGVVSIRGFRLVLFLAELNKLDLWATDIGNAYLEAYTSEKVYIIGGPEFGELDGHILVISNSEAVVHVGMTSLPILCLSSTSLHARQSQTSGCAKVTKSMNMSRSMWMILLLQ
jgi:hypothetical protein